MRERKTGAINTLVSVIILASLVIMGVTAVQRYHQYYDGFGLVLLVDGQEAGFFYEEDKGEIENFIILLTAKAADNYAREVMLNEEIEYFVDRRPGEHLPLEEVQDFLHEKLSFSVPGYILLLNGRETVTLASMEEYEEVINAVKAAYLSDATNAVVREISLQEEIQYIRRPVTPEETISVEKAVDLLLRGTTRREVYLVSRGDSLWTIARQKNISVSELQEANPQVKNNNIRPGDELSLVVSEPMVNVYITKEIAVIEKIAFETVYTSDSKMWTTQSREVTPGQRGEREVTYRLNLENGIEVEREKLHQTVLKEPTTRVVARGTARIPSFGTGDFLWPLAPGVGTISSPFGWRRGRMHGGVDIATRTGTAIRAADSGVVAFSGWQGWFGNLVIIDHGNGYETYYAHNSRNMVSQGQRVARGQTIALIGSTGNSTGPHVHFEIRYNGKRLDPLRFFSP